MNDRGRRLIEKLSEFQGAFAHLRSYSGPFDPQLPRTVFHILFCPPLHCSIDPFETFGILQRIFHGKDGKYLAVSFGAQPRFWREPATAEDRRLISILREIREIAREERIWATYVDGDGSWFPPYSFAPGVLQPPPGDPVVVPFDDYFHRLVEHDLTDPPAPGELISDSVDMNDLARLAPSTQLVDVMPDECHACAAPLTERNENTTTPLAGYMRDTRQCMACRLTYVRVPLGHELTPAESDRRAQRRAVVDEFIRRIAEEFPPPASSVRGEDVAGPLEPEDPFDLFGGQTFGTSDESWRGGQ